MSDDNEEDDDKRLRAKGSWTTRWSPDEEEDGDMTTVATVVALGDQQNKERKKDPKLGKMFTI